MLPTFFILGAAKCGTTSLHELLAQHPDICMSNPKEPFFFEAEFENGPDYYLKTYFPHYTGEKEVGESRHRNLYLPYVPRRIHELVPDARFLVLVRQPVDRAWSHWWHWYVRDVEKNPFDVAISRNLDRLENNSGAWSADDTAGYVDTLDRENGYSPTESYIDSGYYARQVGTYADIFGRDRIKILFFEDLVADPLGTAQAVFEFLQLPVLQVPNTMPRNISVSKKALGLLDLLGRLPGVGLFPPRLRGSLREALARLNAGDRPKMSTEIRAMLMNHFEPHVRELEEITGRQLPEWRN